MIQRTLTSAPTPLAVLVFVMAAFEGKPGDLNWKNNNPCNLRYAKQPHTTGMDPNHFAIFDTIEHGFEAAENQILLDLRRNQALTLKQLVDLWAPPSDGNTHNLEYATFAAHAFGLAPTATLRDVLSLL